MFGNSIGNRFSWYRTDSCGCGLADSGMLRIFKYNYGQWSKKLFMEYG